MRRVTRRSSSFIALPEVTEPAKIFSTKFSLTPYVKRVQQLTDEQRILITKMGFGSVLEVPNHSLNKKLLGELIERWDCKKKAFIFHLGEISMSHIDAALILGLRVVGNPVILNDDMPFSELEEQYGATMYKNKRNVTVASLESKLDSLGNSTCDDFVRAFLLYTLGAFLFPNSNGKVDSRYLSFLQNLDNVCKFAWGAAVIEHLAQWLDRRKEDNVRYVAGCLWFLQAWSYEHFDIGRPSLQDHGVTFPRLCRWDHGKSRQKHCFTTMFKDLHDDQVIWTLMPTSQELEKDIIKEALGLQDDKELRSAQSCSTSSSIYVLSVDSALQLSTSNCIELNRGTCDEVHKEEVNLENLIVAETPPSSVCGEVNNKEEFNVEKLIVLDTPTRSNCDEVCCQKVVNHQILIVDDTPTKSNCDEVCCQKEVNHQILIVDDTPTKSNCDEVCSEKEVNLEILSVDNTPTKSNYDEMRCEKEVNIGKLTVEGSSTKSTEEVNLERLIVEDSSTKFSNCDGDLRRKFSVSEEEKVELKEKISQLMEENRLLHRQVLLNSKFEVQNAELKKEVEVLREENQALRHRIDYRATQLERLIFFEETNETE